MIVAFYTRAQLQAKKNELMYSALIITIAYSVTPFPLNNPLSSTHVFIFHAKYRRISSTGKIIYMYI